MDDLTYTYKNSGNSNQLARVSDAVTTTGVPEVEQFEDGNTSGDDYGYDASGNLTQDLNKGISSITYNHLNKPTLVTFSNGQKIAYIYDAAGMKLRQKVFANGGTSSTEETDYLGAFHYEDADGDGSGATPEMLFFSHEEGRVRRAGTELIYETFLKDHLGNVRVMFTDADEDGWVDPADQYEVLQVDHYYPFGLRLAGLSTAPGVPNFYTFTGKEYQDELGLGWTDFGARMYNASIGRWNGVDQLAELYQSKSSYHFVANNPLRYVDVDGRHFWEPIHVRQARKRTRQLRRQGLDVDFKKYRENGKVVASVVAYGENTTYAGTYRGKSENPKARQKAGYVWTSQFGSGPMRPPASQYVHGYVNTDLLSAIFGAYGRGSYHYSPKGLFTLQGKANGDNAGELMLGLATQAKDFGELVISQPVKSAVEVNAQVQLKRVIVKIHPRKENGRMIGKKNPYNSNETFLTLEADLYHDTIIQNPNGTIDTTRGRFLGRKTFTHPEEVLGTPQE